MILVTGVSGSVGGAVLSELLRSESSVRGFYRSQDEANKALPKVETAIGDFADRASLDRALDGVETVFLVCSPIPQLVEFESNVIEACRASGVKRLVLNSAFGAGQYDKSFPAWHSVVEQRLKASGVPFTILRPESFMQNIVTYYSGTIRSEGAFYAAGGTSPLAFIDLRDIAAVAAACLTREGHTGATYTLTGSEVLSYAEVAERISKLTGTTVRYVDLPPAKLRQSLLGLGMPAWQVEALIDLQAFYTAGPGTTISGDVAKVLGREPIPFDQFLHDYAGSFAAEKTKA
jgi:uncharacterized protein YbjT (DUF2867 family)